MQAFSADQITIRRPAAEVWAFIDEPDNEPRWQPGAVDRRRTTVGPPVVGTRIVQTDLFMGRRFTSEWEVADRSEFLRTDRTSSGGVHVEVTRRVDPVEGGARVTMTVSAGSRLVGPLGWMAASAAVRAARRDMKRALGELKDLLEAP